MNKRDTIAALLVLSAAPFAAFAQQPGKVWRIGMLETTSMTQNAVNLNAFVTGMQELGYVESRNFVIDYRSADGRNERFPDLASELIRGKVDLILTRGTPATLAAKAATTTIPVVATATADPLQFASSLARPGGNITGLTPINTELFGKRVQLLREIFPGLARFGYLQNMGNTSTVLGWRELENAARSLGVLAQRLDVRKPEDLGPAFEFAVNQHVNAIVVGQDGLIQANGKYIIALAVKHRLPAIYQAREFVVDGGLISYGVSYPDLYRRAASYVDRILKGARPGDLPIEQPTKFELVINLKTAKALDIAIPQSVLVRADELIQ